MRHVKTLIEADLAWPAGLPPRYNFGIENPLGDLRHRPFMQPSDWTVPMTHHRFDCCAFQYALKCQKPMSFFTSLANYQPKGTTGNGLCNGGECGMKGPDGKHTGQLARAWGRGPTGKGSKKQKNSLPDMWLREMLTHAKDQARAEGRSADIVIDVCAGWQSLKPVCEELGLRYIAIEKQGDRNLEHRGRPPKSDCKPHIDVTHDRPTPRITLSQRQPYPQLRGEERARALTRDDRNAAATKRMAAKPAHIYCPECQAVQRHGTSRTTCQCCAGALERNKARRKVTFQTNL